MPLLVSFIANLLLQALEICACTVAECSCFLQCMASFLFLPVGNHIFIAVYNYCFFAFISCIYKNLLRLPTNPTVSSDGNVIFTEENILPKHVVKLGQMHCFLKYTDMKFDGSISSFIHFFPGSDKVALMENVFRGEVLLLVSVGAVLQHGNRRHRKKKITLFHVLYMPADETEWGCLMRGTRNMGYYPVFFTSLPTAWQIAWFVCMCLATYSHIQILKSLQFFEVLVWDRGYEDQERKMQITGDSAEREAARFQKSRKP